MTIDETIAELRAGVRRAHERLAGIEVEMMHGDNLAVSLCSYFDDADGEEDDNGWTEAAVRGYEQTIAAIQAHYAAAIDPVLDALTAAEAREKALREALEPFANLADAVDRGETTVMPQSWFESAREALARGR